jgi:hypothetical protein
MVYKTMKYTHTKHNLRIRCGERIRSVMSLVCKMISLKNIIELRFLYIQFVYLSSIIIEIIVVLYSISRSMCLSHFFIFFLLLLQTSKK